MGKTIFAGTMSNSIFSKILYHLSRFTTHIMGYIPRKGHQTQINIQDREGLNGTYFILSGIPIDDTGGGARCTQIALELLRRDYIVVFINKYPKYESHDLDLQISHPNLYTIPIKRFSIRNFIDQHKELLTIKPTGVLVEFPLDKSLPIKYNYV